MKMLRLARKLLVLLAVVFVFLRSDRCERISHVPAGIKRRKSGTAGERHPRQGGLHRLRGLAAIYVDAVLSVEDHRFYNHPELMPSPSGGRSTTI